MHLSVTKMAHVSDLVAAVTPNVTTPFQSIYPPTGTVSFQGYKGFTAYNYAHSKFSCHVHAYDQQDNRLEN